MTNPKPPELAEPTLIDLALSGYITSLESCLWWLTACYGRSERHPAGKSLSDGYIPALFVGQDDSTTSEREYLPLLPDAHQGNFSFWEVSAQQVTSSTGGNVKLVANVGLILWFDFTLIYPNDHVSRTAENVKSEVLAALSTARSLNTRLDVTGIVDNLEEIYKGYQVRKLPSTFGTRPYGVFRVNATITHHQLKC